MLQARILGRIEQRRSSATGSIVERVDPSSVVLGDPVLDGLERTARCVGDVLGGSTLLGEHDSLGSAPDPLLVEGAGEFLELFHRMVIGDEHE